MDKLKKLHNFIGDNRASLGLLIIRLMFGIGIAIHGWGKIQTPFGWMGPDAPVPGILQFLAAFSEFVGGLALAAGAIVPLFSFLLAVTMFVAVIFHMQKGDGFVQGWEMAALYLSVAVALFIAGPGKYSVDAKFCKK